MKTDQLGPCQRGSLERLEASLGDRDLSRQSWAWTALVSAGPGRAQKFLGIWRNSWSHVWLRHRAKGQD